MKRSTQADPLAAAGVSGATADELRAHLANPFDVSRLGPGARLPLPDEPFVPCWEGWAEEARRRGAVEVLSEHLPQLSFPIREGISRSEEYRAATRRGVPPGQIPSATGLSLERPGLVELAVHASPAGRIPVLVIRGRGEFVALVRALARRNEPSPVPDSQGAAIVGGYNNWARIEQLRRQWKSLPPGERPTATWGEEIERLQGHKELYQDRFLLLSDGPYSAVPAADLGLEEGEWRQLSLAIRRDHECAHYFTRRLFGSMKNHLHDELLADYAGLVAATGRFRADWFLRFLGLDTDPVRTEGRVHLYRGDPPLSDEAFRGLQHLVRRAAANVEHFDATLPESRGLTERSVALAALAASPLPELASSAGAERLAETFETIRARIGGGGDGEEAS